GSDHLEGRYGTEAEEVLALCNEDPSLAEPISDALPYLKAEAVFAARHEMAQTLDDILSRRTRSRILNAGAAAEVAAPVARLVATELGWDESEQRSQVATFVAAVESEREAMTGEPEQSAAANL
ncbi:MAG TPA: glycerol-3-phosphate dehydrogenase C-terminal domain-containing protein, partial [Acidimicrobiales bacterium]|nr:glycerol-3-phosphate dehydrogenase C-terminal domain-containing protein [Acidimicrobiales bacterium]